MVTESIRLQFKGLKASYNQSHPLTGRNFCTGGSNRLPYYIITFSRVYVGRGLENLSKQLVEKDQHYTKFIVQSAVVNPHGRSSLCHAEILFIGT